MPARKFESTVAGYLTAVLGVAATAAVLKPFGNHVNPTTVALALLMVVLFVATKWSARPAVVAAMLGMLFFNFFFLPPTGTFTISDSDNWVGLVAFLITAVTAGQLSSRAKRRAEEAEAGRREIERKVLTHRTLLAAIWGGNFVEQTEYLRVFIGQLRKKIEPGSAAPRYILTEPWIGYRFDPGP